MRRADRTPVRPASLLVAAGLVAAGLLAASGCGAEAGWTKSPATVRAARRAYDGAPPVIPHRNFGITCLQCHNERGIEVAGVGTAPASPHAGVAGAGAFARCRQCHVFRTVEAEFVASEFVGLPQDLRRGERMYPGAPPVIPHRVFMRENCRACHTGPAAREQVRTSHPERARCRQCHVPQVTSEEFRPPVR